MHFVQPDSRWKDKIKVKKIEEQISKKEIWKKQLKHLEYIVFICLKKKRKKKKKKKKRKKKKKKRKKKKKKKKKLFKKNIKRK